MNVGETAEETVNAMFHLLNNATIPKGLMVEDNGQSEYTQYRVVYNVTNGTYYFNPYETQEVFFIGIEERVVTIETAPDFCGCQEFHNKNDGVIIGHTTVDAKIDK
ncbi:MAG: linear amide C-N hydrolase [Enterococcus gallinarum]